MSVRRNIRWRDYGGKHETPPPRLKLKRRYPIEEINIEARKNREEGINGVLPLYIYRLKIIIFARSFIQR